MRNYVTVLLVVGALLGPVRAIVAAPTPSAVFDSDIPIRDRLKIGAIYSGIIVAIGGAWAWDRYRNRKLPTADAKNAPVTYDADTIDAIKGVLDEYETAMIELGADVTDKHLTTLIRVPIVTRLDMSKSKVTDAGFKSIGQLKSLRQLKTSVTVTAVGLLELKPLADLNELDLSALEKFGDRELDALKQLSMRRLIVAEGVLAEEAMRELQAALPKTMVTAIPSTKKQP